MACAASLVAEPEPAREVRKVVTVVFCDIAGSTAKADGTDPEVVRAVLARYYEQMRAALERHGGTVEKFIGDAVMAVFGVPVVREDDALRAVRAAAEMRDELVAAGITARIGVNTGEVVAAPGESLVTGDPVNVAARLEQAAPVGGVLIGDATLALVRDAARVEPVEPLAAKGKRDPLIAWRLVDVGAGGRGVAGRSDVRLVGRARERRLLLDAYVRANDERRCVLFTVMGRPGVGKSRLVAELIAEVAGEAEVLSGSCLSYGEGITYWPVAEIVRTAAGISDSDPGTAALAALERLVAGDREGQVIARQVASAIGLADAATTPADSAWAVRRLLELVARDRPLVVVVEDIHWAQPVLLDLIEHVADWSRGAPILLCCTARPDLLEARPTWGDGSTNATTIPLEPLAEEDCSALCDELLGDAEITGEQRRRVLDLAEGNPLFVEQMLAMLQAGGVEAADIPPTIDALLAARLDQLPMDERNVVESASIEGRVFHRSAVATLLPQRAPTGVDENLLHLIRQELIDSTAAQFAGERAFSFGHVLICDAAYRAAPKRRRATQHELFAGWLQDKAADRLGEFEELLAHHLARAVTLARDLDVQDEHTAELAERAAHHYRRVADRALSRRDSRAGTDALAQVATLLPAGDPRVPVVVALHALAAAQFFDQTEAQSWADQAIQLAPPGINDPVRGFAETIRDWLGCHVDPSIDSTGFNQRTRVRGEAAELAGETDIAAWLWLLAANYTSVFLLRPADAMTDIARATRLLPGVDSRWLEDEVDSLRMFCMLWGPGRIPGLLAQALPRQASTATFGSFLRHTSLLYAHRGDEAAALRAIDEFSDIQDKLGKGWEMMLVAEWTRGQVYSLLDKPADAIGPYRRALEGNLEQGQIGFASTISGGLASSLSRSGDYQAALEEAARARTLTGPGDIASKISWRAAKAHALAHLGDVDAATPLAGEAVDLAMSTQVPSCRFETSMDAADVYRIAGAMPRARELLTQALDESTAREADGLSGQAKAALTRLQGT